MKKPNPELIDQDNPEWTEAEFAKARSAEDVLPDLLGKDTATQLLKPRGRPRSARPKIHINIRIDEDVLEQWKSTGRGWQTRMAATLKQYAPH